MYSTLLQSFFYMLCVCVDTINLNQIKFFFSPFLLNLTAQESIYWMPRTMNKWIGLSKKLLHYIQSAVWFVFKTSIRKLNRKFIRIKFAHLWCNKTILVQMIWCNHFTAASMHLWPLIANRLRNNFNWLNVVWFIFELLNECVAWRVSVIKKMPKNIA